MPFHAAGFQKPTAESSSEIERFERLEDALRGLAERSLEGAVILVEGLNDRAALRRIGIQGKICCVKTGRSTLPELLDGFLGVKEIIVLTDFDRRGRELAARITRYLEREGKTANLRFRAKIQSLVAKEVKDIEGLASYVSYMRKTVYHSSEV